MRFTIYGLLEPAVAIWRWQLAAKSQIYRRQNDCHVLRGLPRFIAAQVAAPRIDVALTRGDDMRRTGGVVRLVAPSTSSFTG